MSSALLINAVTPINVATNTTEANIPVGNNPLGIAITPDGSTAYVANNYSDTVTPIDLATDAAEPAINVGSGPSSVAVTPDGHTVFVANTAAGTVTPIHTATNTVGATIAVGTSPQAIAISPDQAPTASLGSRRPTPDLRQPLTPRLPRLP